MKNKSLLGIVVLAVLYLVTCVFFSQAWTKIKTERDQERYQRLLAEEEALKTRDQVEPLKTALEKAQQQSKSVQSILEESKLANEKLMSDFSALMKAKQELEGKLADVVAAELAPPVK